MVLVIKKDVLQNKSSTTLNQQQKKTAQTFSYHFDNTGCIAAHGF